MVLMPKIAKVSFGKLISSQISPPFRPKKVILLNKITRFQYLNEIFSKANAYDSHSPTFSHVHNYEALKESHLKQQTFINSLQKVIESFGINVHSIDADKYCSEVVEEVRPDLIVTGGGDGTFLVGAQPIMNSEIPLLGINSDPSSSQGHLLAPGNLTAAQIFERLADGRYVNLPRQRARITMSESGGAPVTMTSLHTAEDDTQIPSTTTIETSFENDSVIFPHHALNEVFLGQRHAARVSAYEISIDGGPWVPHKDSGVTVSTGTGSSSWFFTINSLHSTIVSRLLHRYATLTNAPQPIDDRVIKKVVDSYNQDLIFSPDTPLLAYSHRDPIMNAVYSIDTPIGRCKSIRVRSLMGADACIVVDGATVFSFPAASLVTVDLDDVPLITPWFQQLTTSVAEPG